MSDETTPPSDPARIEAEIEQTRAELADTVNQLADKLDVKAQVGRRAQSIKDSAPEPVQQALDRVTPAAQRAAAATRPYGGKILAGAAVSVVGLLVLRRAHRKDDT